MKNMEIKTVDVMSWAKIALGMGIVIGFIAGIFIAFGSIAGGLIGGKAGIGMGFGFFSIIIFPIIYGIGGFIAGAFWALIYNIVAMKLGGVVLRVEDK
ncbi:MAG: hypothetical protein ABIH00_10120 [Armatimonadota bacterium]